MDTTIFNFFFFLEKMANVNLFNKETTDFSLCLLAQIQLFSCLILCVLHRNKLTNLYTVHHVLQLRDEPTTMHNTKTSALHSRCNYQSLKEETLLSLMYHCKAFCFHFPISLSVNPCTYIPMYNYTLGLGIVFEGSFLPK